jgi:SAM-dependent methyltransferase
VKAVTYDGRTLPFANQQFDIVWSNAVLEHVGDRSAQLQFIRELRRVGKHGYLTTPNRYFPIEVHTRMFLLHLLPKSWFDWILRRVGKSWAAGEYMRLLGESELRQLLREAGLSNPLIIKNRLIGMTLDFVIIF